MLILGVIPRFTSLRTAAGLRDIGGSWPQTCTTQRWLPPLKYEFFLQRSIFQLASILSPEIYNHKPWRIPRTKSSQVLGDSASAVRSSKKRGTGHFGKRNQFLQQWSLHVERWYVVKIIKACVSFIRNDHRTRVVSKASKVLKHRHDEAGQRAAASEAAAFRKAAVSDCKGQVLLSARQGHACAESATSVSS